MILEKNVIYSNAYVELIEILKRLPTDEFNKIPKIYVDNLNKNKNQNYHFIYDETKEPNEQNFMTETKAIFVDLYIRYIATDDEKDVWKEYDKYCFQKIENEKKKKYDKDNLFDSNSNKIERNSKEKLDKKNIDATDNSIENKGNLIVYNESFIKKIFNAIKKIFYKK